MPWSSGGWDGRAPWRRWWPVVAVSSVLVLLVVLLVVRQGSGPGSAREASAQVEHDPPTGFDDGAGTALPRDADADPLPGVLHDHDAFLALPGGLEVIDTRTGRSRALVTPSGDVAPGNGGVAAAPQASGDAAAAAAAAPLAPVLVSLGGMPAVVAAFVVQVPGHGTTVGHDAVQLVAVDAADYAPRYRARIDLPPTLSDAGAVEDAWPVGVAGSVLVVSVEVGPDRVPASYGVDLTAHRLLWQRPRFRAGAVVGGLVVGAWAMSAGRSAVGAVSASDGTPRWTAPGSDATGVQIWRGGPTLVAVTRSDPVTGTRMLALLDTTTGAVRSVESGAGGLTCRYDERATTVCFRADSGLPWVAGYDAVTGRRLWQLPDARAGRVAPRVSTAWHGTVYGSTDDGPVALDARSGADRPTSPRVAPDLVNGFVGITAATSLHPRPVAYPAIS